jgi:plastocyanin
VPIALDPDPACDRLHPGGLAIPEVRVSGERLADVFVYVKRGLEDRVFRVPDDPVVVDQRGCLFVPRVVGVQAGQPVRFVNSDETLHNVHGMPTRSSAWNFGMGHVGATRTVTIDTPEVPVPIRCEVHSWMRADLAVVDHPYHAVTGATGTFTLADVPAGEYDLAAWHPRLGEREQHVTVAPGTRTSADFAFADEPTAASPAR